MNQSFNILSRRSFFSHAGKLGLGAALASLIDVPFVVKRALAEGNIGLNGKKLLFIWLRGANDSLNSLIPVEDSAYNTTNRCPTLTATKLTITNGGNPGTSSENGTRILPGATLRSGTNAVLDADGAAIVIHAQADDNKTDPAGNAGGRIACGILSAG